MYRFEDKVEEAEEVEASPVGEREEIQRTEWINPPSIVGARSHHHHHHRSKSNRDLSPGVRSSISRRSPRSRSRAPSGTFVEERKTIIEEGRAPSAPPPPPPPAEFYEEKKTVVEERAPAGTVVLADREYRSDRDINAEIRALELERRALRHEREAEERRDLALRVRERPEEDFQLVEYREHRPRDELVVYDKVYERESPRNVVRVEKDRKGRMALVRSAH